MIELEQAVDQIIAAIASVDLDEAVAIERALGRVLAKPVVAITDQPPFDNSAMDGYAVQAPLQKGDVIDVSARIPAGVEPKPLTQGAARIFTGAVMPAGANSVVMQEQVAVLEREDGSTQIRLDVNVPSGSNVRRAGEDFNCGQTLLEVGEVLGPIELALVAAAGVSEVCVTRKPVVGVLATGDELVAPPNQLKPGQIYNSNQYFLASYVERLGAKVLVHDKCGDTLNETTEALSYLASKCDLIVTSGGASVGEEDHLKDAIRELGELDLYKIKIKPGKPVLFGRVLNVPVLGLPGNPVSSVVTAALILRPCVQRLLGQDIKPLETLSARAQFDRKPAKRREFIRAQVAVDDGQILLAHSYHSQGSGVLSSLGWATHLIDAKPEVAIKKGDEVSLIPLASLQL